VHELLHLQVPNHGKLFKSRLSALVSGWEQYEQSGARSRGEAAASRPID
jgi:predicted metal-dependent hydrolase